jgi:hypothetical protein
MEGGSAGRVGKFQRARSRSVWPPAYVEVEEGAGSNPPKKNSSRAFMRFARGRFSIKN